MYSPLSENDSVKIQSITIKKKLLMHNLNNHYEVPVISLLTMHKNAYEMEAEWARKSSKEWVMGVMSDKVSFK